MVPGDIPGVARVAAEVHPAFPERDAVLASKQALFPAGCLALEQDGAILGYALSHPWIDGPVPKLDTELGALPREPTLLYLHDLALSRPAQGMGLAAEGAERVVRAALEAGFRRIALVAVNGSAPFWTRLGFEDAPAPAGLAASYGEDARYMRRGLRP